MKNPDAVALGRRGGLKGGAARAASLSPEQLSKEASKAARARWKGHVKRKDVARRPSLPARLRTRVWARDGGLCGKCGQACSHKRDEPADRTSIGEVDHINPWSKGGRHVLENLRLLCRRCNRTKLTAGPEFYSASPVVS